MGQFFSQGYDHYEQCNAGVVFLQNTFWSFWFFFPLSNQKHFRESNLKHLELFTEVATITKCSEANPA